MPVVAAELYYIRCPSSFWPTSIYFAYRGPPKHIIGPVVFGSCSVSDQLHFDVSSISRASGSVCFVDDFVRNLVFPCYS